MSNTTHASLLARVAAGIDLTAWGEFHDRYAELIFGFARRSGLSHSDCDDVVQDVLLSLLKAMPGFRYDPEKGKFRAYLKTVTLRAIYKRRQQKSPADGAYDVEAQPPGAAAAPILEQQWEDEWRRHHIRRAMERIQAEFSLENRQAFSLYAIQGRAAEDTASMLGISVAQIYQAKSRILRRLSQVIADQVESEG